MTVPSIGLVPLSPSGSGAPLLLGPSLGTRVAADWGPTVPLLADRPVFGWDLPGHGVSPATGSRFSMAELAEGVLRAASSAGLDSFHAAGVSLGGVVSLAAGLASPDRVLSVTLVCSLPRIGTPSGWAERAAGVRASGTPSLVQGSAARWFAPGFIEREPSLSSGLLTDLMDVDDESYALCVEALGETDLRSRVAELAVPFTLVVGAEDVIIGLTDPEIAVNSAARGRLEVLPGVAHQAAVESPTAVAQTLSEVLS